MKIACLQLAAVLGETDQNIERAESCLADIQPGQLDLLVLPELAFTGYNFSTLEEITPHLEPTSAGVSTQWAIKTARRLNCAVQVGYPEVSLEPPQKRDISLPATETQHAAGIPVRPNYDPDFPCHYNSSVLVNSSGEVVAHYRKCHLYYTDVIWAREGSGFYAGQPFKRAVVSNVEHTESTDGITSGLAGQTIAMGICMDLNAYNFVAPWTAWEFSTHVVSSSADLVLISMAWLSSDLNLMDVLRHNRLQPDMNTLGYWIERFRPLVQQPKQTVVVCANRAGVEGTTCYAGTSAVLKLGMDRIEVFDILGRGEEKLLLVDTDKPPRYVMRYRDSGQDDRVDGGEPDSNNENET